MKVVNRNDNPLLKPLLIRFYVVLNRRMDLARQLLPLPHSSYQSTFSARIAVTYFFKFHHDLIVFSFNTLIQSMSCNSAKFHPFVPFAYCLSLRKFGYWDIVKNCHFRNLIISINFATCSLHNWKFHDVLVCGWTTRRFIATPPMVNHTICTKIVRLHKGTTF